MTVRELITMLMKVNMDAVVTASDIYDDGTFSITGMVFNEAGVDLTGEDASGSSAL